MVDLLDHPGPELAGEQLGVGDRVVLDDLVVGVGVGPSSTTGAPAARVWRIAPRAASMEARPAGATRTCAGAGAAAGPGSGSSPRPAGGSTAHGGGGSSAATGVAGAAGVGGGSTGGNLSGGDIFRLMDGLGIDRSGISRPRW